MNKIFLPILFILISNLLFSQAADEPCDAQTLYEECDLIVHSSAGYSTTFPSSSFTCGNPQGENDAFVQFVAPAGGVMKLVMATYDGGAFNQANFFVNLMEGPCSNLSIVDTETFTSDVVSTPTIAECIDLSADGLGNANNTPILLEGLTGGQTYFLRITEEQDDTNGDMVLFFTDNNPLPNDFCADALELTGTDSYDTCNFEATDTGESDSWNATNHTGNFGGQNQPVQTCTGDWSSNENMVWYYFVVTDNTPQPISITAENVQCTGAGNSLQLGIWYQGLNPACAIGDMTGVGCAVGVGDLTVTLPDDVPNGTYYVGIDGNGGSLCSWQFTSPQILPTCPTGPTATTSSTDICSGSTIDLTLSFATPGGNGASGVFDLSASPSAGVSFSTGSTDVAAGTSTVSFPANQTCSPITYTITADAKCLTTDGVVTDITPDPAAITVTVYPAALSVATIDDGASCGTPTVELQATNGTACETQSGIGSGTSASGACATNGDALNYDFSSTATVSALANAPAGCTLPALSGTVTCSGCVSCSIDNIVAGNQIPCDPSTDTYDQEVIITFTDAPASGNLVVNGQTFAIGTSPQTVLLTGLPSDGNPVSVTASFSADAACSLSLNNVFTAPTTCVSCTDGIQNGQETGLDCGGPSCPPCPTCSVSKTYTGTTLTGIYQTSNTINSYAEVPSGEDVSLLAACINLYEGFEVKLGAEFLADPVPCIPLTDSGTTSLQEEEHFIMAQDNKDIRVSFYLNNATNVDLRIKSTDGAFEDLLIPNQAQLAGEHLVQIDASPLKAGIYFLVFKTDKNERIERVVIQ